MLRFVKGLIALRKRHPSLQRRRFLSGRPKGESAMLPDISWQGSDGGPPKWDDPSTRTLAFTLAATQEGEGDLQILINMNDEPRAFKLQVSHGRTWYLALDTARAEPEDTVRDLHRALETLRHDPRTRDYFLA